MDETLDSKTPNQGKMRALHTRKHVLDLIEHLHCDVFNQDKFLIIGVEIKMRLVRSKDSFCLIETKSTSKIRILDASRKKNKNKFPAYYSPMHGC